MSKPSERQAFGAGRANEFKAHGFRSVVGHYIAGTAGAEELSKALDEIERLFTAETQRHGSEPQNAQSFRPLLVKRGEGWGRGVIQLESQLRPERA